MTIRQPPQTDLKCCRITRPKFKDRFTRCRSCAAYIYNNIRQLMLCKATTYYFSENIHNLMREGEKKTLKKKTIEPIFGIVNAGDQIKKNIGQISGKVNDSDQIKNNKKKPNEGDEKEHIWKNVFLLPQINLSFFRNVFFYLPKLNVFFQKSATIQCARSFKTEY